MPDLKRISEAVADAFGVEDVFGAPVERDGTLVIPVARVWSAGGGGGGGGGEAVTTDRPASDGGGGGVGFRRRAAPVGAYVIDDAGMRWVPALDVNRIVLGGQVVLMTVAFVVGWAVARRR